MRKILIVFFLALFAGTARADELGPQLQEIANRAVVEDAVTGIVLGVGRAGQAPTLSAAGLADIERHLPMTPAAGFKAASIAKTFLAALALQLVEEHRLTLHDKLARFLPDVPNAARVSLRQLLNHTSGYDDYITDAFADAASAHPGKSWTSRELLAFAKPERLRFTPGIRYDYSNTNYLLLGMAIEKSTGESLARSIRRRLLEPLGLKHTWLAAEEAIPLGQLAHGYVDRDDSGAKKDTTAEPWPLGGADGAMVSDAADLIAWSHALFGGRVLPQRRLAEMLDFVSAPEEEGVAEGGYGLGVERLQIDGITFYGHTGSAPGYNSMMLYEPMTRTAIVAAINEDPTDEALLDILVERVVQAIEATAAPRFPRTPDSESQSPAKE